MRNQPFMNLRLKGFDTRRPPQVNRYPSATCIGEDPHLPTASPLQQFDRAVARCWTQVHVAHGCAQVRVAGEFLNRLHWGVIHRQSRTERAQKVDAMLVHAVTTDARTAVARGVQGARNGAARGILSPQATEPGQDRAAVKMR